MHASFYIGAADRQRAAERLKASGGTHLLPLVDAAEHGVTTVFVVGRERFPVRRIHREHGMVVIIGDDLHTAQGPSGYHLRTLTKLAGKANAWAVMSGAPVPAVYAAAAVMATTGAIVLLVETQIREELSWTEYLRCRGRPTAAKLLVSPSAKKAA